MDYSIFCTAENRTDVNALAESLYPSQGPNTCSVALSTTEGVTDPALATHYGGAGPLSSEVAEGLRLSIDPPVNVLEHTGGADFASHCASVQTNGVTTPLHLINEPI